MPLFLSRTLRLWALAAELAACVPSLAAAQTAGPATTSSLLDVGTTVPEGEVVHVTDTRGRTTRAVLRGVTSDAVQVTVDGEPRTVAGADVQRVRWQQRDSWLRGAVVGAAVGAIPGIYYLATDPNECTGLCPEEYALVGLGALLGGLIDRAITRKVTIYERASTAATGTTSVAPVWGRARRGVRMTLRF